MDRTTFIVDKEDGGLAWLTPEHAPDLTDEQARTIAIAKLAGAVDRLAEAITRFADARIGAGP